MMNKEAVNQKAINVVTSCKTIPQLNVALNYIKLAKKSRAIGNDTFYLMVGVISAMKGFYGQGAK
mgnify:FL=1